MAPRVGRGRRDVNFYRFIRYHARIRGRACAVRDGRNALTYAELDERAGRIGGALLQRGARPGLPVAVVARNSLDLAVLYAAILRIGAAFAPLNFRLVPQELASLRRLLGEPLTIAGEEFASLLDGCLPMSELDRAARTAAPAPLAMAGSASPNNILFTSGTTGLPKGATLSHANVITSAANAAMLRRLDERAVCYVPLPLYHTAGLHGQLIPAWYVGGEAWILREWDLDQVAQDLSADRMSSVSLLPEQWADLAALLTGLRLRNMSDCRTAGSRVKDEIIATIEEMTGRAPNFGMGMTEASPHLNFMEGRLLRRHNGTVGRPTPYADITVRDEEGNDVPDGEVGEMCVSGPLVMSGYWNDEAATRAAFDARGAFRTGDLVVRDDEGFIRIVDRKKDLIRSGGENVFCVEVEQVLLEHPRIAEVAVVGYPHEKWGEAVAAVIVAAPGGPAPTLEEIQAWARQFLASYKKPLRLEVLERLPRNRTGKVLKGELRARLGAREANG